jgi:hypothetical protein
VTVAVVVLAALVVVLAGVLAVQGRRTRDRVAATDARAERAEAAAAERANELAAARDAAGIERERAAEDLRGATAARADLERQLSATRAEASEAARRRTEAEAELSAQRSRADAAEAEVGRLAHDLGEAESRAARVQLRLDAAAGTPTELSALWALELARSERTWRYSVAPMPTGPSPFPGVEDPLRLAVEVEAAALREEVGAPLSVRWAAAPVRQPGHALLVLRLAQEVLAAAAREGQAAVLSVREDRDGDVVLDLRAEDDGDPAPKLPVPGVPAELVTAEIGEGLRLVVHQDRVVATHV